MLLTDVRASECVVGWWSIDCQWLAMPHYSAALGCVCQYSCVVLGWAGCTATVQSLCLATVQLTVQLSSILGRALCAAALQ